ncbi:MAG: hypothetical protein IIA88_08670 [Bacteroidetes bacterium]|nr:hypothetical protein [Bacteroidota bacterium]
MFTIIEEYKRFRKVTFYTLRYEDSELSETDKFIERFMNDENYKVDLDEIFYNINDIGENRGAEQKYFRHEGKAEALPPKGVQSKLRLYCIWLTDSIVILANGGVKSSQTAQDSRDLSMKFHFANKVANEVNKCIAEGLIRINRNSSSLEGELELYF